MLYSVAMSIPGPNHLVAPAFFAGLAVVGLFVGVWGLRDFFRSRKERKDDGD